MVVAKAIFTHFLSFLLSFVITLVPYAGHKPNVLETSKDNCKLNIAVMSDLHLEEKTNVRNGVFKVALKNISNAKSAYDTVVIPGDVTNYADEPALSEYYRIINKLSSVPVITVAGNHDIGHAGDRDVTDISREQAMANFIKYRNEYTGRKDTANYYSTEVNGYKFIILGDECLNGGFWDDISMTQEQLKFLDDELKAGTKDGLPCFVCCHWPVDGMNDVDIQWPGSCIDKNIYDIHSILKQYKNVFYISGHMHAGVKANIISDICGLSNAEKVDGVTYINVSCFGIINMFGLPWNGTGASIEVYDNEVIFRPVNYFTQNWYENAVFTFELDK